MSAMPDRLWAKSGGKTLPDHTADVLHSARLLFGTATHPTRLAQSWFRFFRLADYEGFHASLQAAAVLHDIGKASSSFQDAINHGAEQCIRHEHISAWLLTSDILKPWLQRIPHIDCDQVIAAVYSHHFKAGDDALQWQAMGKPRIFSTHPDFLACLAQLAPIPDTLPAQVEWSLSAPSYQQARKSLQLSLHRADRRFAGDPEARKMLWAIRTALVVCDAAGSAEVRMGEPLPAWLASAFDSAQLCDEQTIWTKIVAPRLDQLKAAGRWSESRGVGGWSQFQNDAAELPSRSLLLAPCGSGKTLAAWRWIAAQCHRCPPARVIFLYPTRATATEGFRDYVSWAPETDAAMLHGTSRYELQGLFANPADMRSSRQYTTDDRLFALGNWQKRIFSATIDQFLAFLHYGYGPTCLLPLLADSVIVVDEVHSFDRDLFSSFCQFLQHFDVPVLAMTATLQKGRLDALKERGLHVYSEKPADLKIIADKPRYRVRRIDAAAAPEIATRALAEGKRVLWVVNLVRRAQTLALALARKGCNTELVTADGTLLLCYHSRFTLEHRKGRHAAIVHAFQQTPALPVLGITTQVCEMSLDLDADVLMTEEAPIPSLIQRMGRCNRIAETTKVGEVYVYRPQDAKPYDPAVLCGATEFLAHLCQKDTVSQSDLELAMERYSTHIVEAQRIANFVDSGPYAVGSEQSLRDIDEFTLPGVLCRDVERYAALATRREPVDGLVCPVPRKLARERDERLPKWMVVAPDDHYHPLLGLCDTAAEGAY